MPRQSIDLQKKMDARIKSGHDDVIGSVQSHVNKTCSRKKGHRKAPFFLFQCAHRASADQATAAIA
jgi:hypothetical protein